MPAAANSDRLYVSIKNPRSSACTRGVIRSTSGIASGLKSKGILFGRESLPLVGSAEGTEDVRDVADAAERDREMKPRVLSDGCRREACEVDELILGREAAALRVVIARDAVLGE